MAKTKSALKAFALPFYLPIGIILMILSGTGAAQKVEPRLEDDVLPLNRFQFIGTHNSYHIAPSPKLRQLIENVVPGQGNVLAYTHRPLREQLEVLGIRQIELDLYNDPNGGLYANPLGPRVAHDPPVPADPEMKLPGLKILHSPDFDTNTTVSTLKAALKELKGWSDAHPTHEPVMVLLELKSDSFSPSIKPPAFDEASLLTLEAEIKSVLPLGEILRPDDVKAGFPTLRDAVTTRGWPTLAATKGKFIFTLDNEDEVRDKYLSLSPQKDLSERLCFVSVSAEHVAAAWMKKNDPVGSFNEIRTLVGAGFMVRTRADADLKEPLANDHSMWEKAAQSGAQWISTDAPEKDERWPNYAVMWPNHAIYRIRPTN